MVSFVDENNNGQVNVNLHTQTVLIQCNEIDVNIKEENSVCNMFYIEMGPRSGISGNDLIREYFFAGYTYSEIMLILFYRHEITISLRQLNRVLRLFSLRRHNPVTAETIQAVREEIQTSGSSLGYRSMTRRLLTRHGIVISRSRVSYLQRQLDPDGVSNRQMHRFSRRAYVNKGPNYLIHIDGYDKLKRFGFAIHGAICGFSRRVLWLKAAYTNNNPKVVAAYFMEYISEIKAVPRCLRIDAGTENVLIEDIQRAFRCENNDDAAEQCVVKGSSHSNQRIERWWLSNRQGGCQFWIDMFKDLESLGLISTANELQIQCARFCFMELLQTELDTVRAEWNQHYVRRNTNSETPNGKPDIMYFFPNLYGTVDYKVPVRGEDIGEVNSFCFDNNVLPANGCPPDVALLLESAMRERILETPSTVREAMILYGTLVQYLNDQNI